MYNSQSVHHTAVRNLEHDDLKHPKPSSIFTFLMDVLCLVYFLLGEHLHAIAIKSLPQSFQIIIIIIMEDRTQSVKFSFLFFSFLIATAAQNIHRTHRLLYSIAFYIYLFFCKFVYVMVKILLMLRSRLVVSRRETPKKQTEAH